MLPGICRKSARSGFLAPKHQVLQDFQNLEIARHVFRKLAWCAAYFGYYLSQKRSVGLPGSQAPN